MSLHPYSNRHAVQSAMLVVGFHEEIDLGEGMTEKANAAFDAIKSVLPNRNPIQMITVQVGASAPTFNESAVGGWEFSHPLDKLPLKGPAVRRSAIVQEKRLAIQENEYNRWADFQGFVSAVLEGLEGYAFAGRRLNSVALGYIDSFVWKDNPSLIDADKVFSSNTEYLPANVFATGSRLFHSSHGFFVDPGDAAVEALVENVNVARTQDPETGQHSFVISTEHRMVPKEPLFGAEAKRFVMLQLEGLHQRNKAVLANLLTEEVQQMIKLGGK